MSMYDQFKTDPQLEKKGIKIDYGDFRVTVARAGGANKRYAQVMEATVKPYRRAIQTETLDNELSNKLLMSVFAKAVVLDWEVLVTDPEEETGTWVSGIENPEGGDPLPVTEENIMNVFQALPDLFFDIKEQSEKMALFRQSVKEVEAGN